jgi:hypothetical protein
VLIEGAGMPTRIGGLGDDRPRRLAEGAVGVGGERGVFQLVFLASLLDALDVAGVLPLGVGVSGSSLHVSNVRM